MAFATNPAPDLSVNARCRHLMSHPGFQSSQANNCGLQTHFASCGVLPIPKITLLLSENANDRLLQDPRSFAQGDLRTAQHAPRHAKDPETTAQPTQTSSATMVRAEYFTEASPTFHQTTSHLDAQAATQIFARHPFYQWGPLATIMGTGDGTYLGSNAAATIAAEKKAHYGWVAQHQKQREEEVKVANEAAKAQGWGGKYGETGWVCGGVGGKDYSVGNTPER